ncbi:adenylate/guanylate cyclase domain-containing protein [Acuticoccus sp. MNP-M23]|uniref:adenylate/guanylate cyclase domain-containing protein n=1 Tax=Acuticoccus sp. MNP-M23 TaxID=3072793 RepID=UPI0028167E94|nr:adenylate/guanylate cyclase domain-containing protein [Acuticoccus sp. MNP-M23]WMS43222.1 adenylate/guanylate cyclase domain-containing protein [Acuticoccus sp. MNP-M23]
MMDPSHRALIEDAERRAERLIGGLRIAIGLVFMAVFNVAIDGSMPSWDVTLIDQQIIARVTILLFIGIGVLAVYLSNRRRYRPWFAFGFVTADALYVLASLFTALANTSTEPALLFALPSFFLVPLIVAFNALRYNWAVQLYGSAILLAGLVLLLGTAAPPQMLHAQLFMAPPNIMRLAMLAAFCAVLGLAVMRARKRLIQALNDQRRRQLLTRFLPARIANLIETQSADALRAGSRQAVTVMFVDIRGFTARAETMAPDAVRRFLSDFRAHIAAAADAHEGVIDKFIGDGALVVFGVPKPRADDPARAASAARQILAAMHTWSQSLEKTGLPPVEIGIGLHTGEAFVGTVGDDARLEFTVIGDVVNVAARLESANKIAGTAILASRAVVESPGMRAKDWRAVAPVQIRGHSKQIDIFTMVEG